MAAIVREITSAISGWTDGDLSCHWGASPLYDRGYRSRRMLERQSFDEDYVRRLTRGDPETERHFTRYFGDLLLIKLRARLRSLQMVEDVRQETFLRVLNVLRKKGGVEHPERLGAFVNSVCENVLCEVFRSGSRLQQMPENASEPQDRGESAEAEFITEERKAMVRSILGDLPEADRSLLRSVFLEERDKDEICRELKITRDYLRVRIHRSLARFRNVLDDREQVGRLRAGA